jgi:hypothetical protein
MREVSLPRGQVSFDGVLVHQSHQMSS